MAGEKDGATRHLSGSGSRPLKTKLKASVLVAGRNWEAGSVCKEVSREIVSVWQPRVGSHRFSMVCMPSLIPPLPSSSHGLFSPGQPETQVHCNCM